MESETTEKKETQIVMSEIIVDQPAEIEESNTQTTHEMMDHYLSIHEKILKLKKEEGQSSRSVPRIKRVPQVLAESVETRNKYFQPRVLFLGPFHEGKVVSNPEALELKQKAAKLFMNAKTAGDVQIWMDAYKEILRDVDKLMKPYALELEYNNESELEKQSQKFREKHAWMLFEDGCAAMYFICGTVDQTNFETKTHEIVLAQQDLFLLENQLPYQVLELLMKRKFPEDNERGRSSIEDFIKMQIPTRSRVGDSGIDTKKYSREHTHLLQHLRTRLAEATSTAMIPRTKTKNPKDATMIPRKKTENLSDASLPMLAVAIINAVVLKVRMKFLTASSAAALPYSCRSAAQLQKRGISFKASYSSSNKKVSFTDSWTSGRLYLPSITIDDLSKGKLLNLVADEMSSDIPNNSEIASYLCFLDSLIDDAEDVKILREANIIQNVLGSDEALANLFNEITKNLVPNNSTYGDVRDAIQSHFNNKRKTWMAQLYDDYFGSPWALIAFSAAMLVVSLSMIQTYLTMVPPAAESSQWQRLFHIVKYWYMPLIMPLPIIILLLLVLLWPLVLINFCGFPSKYKPRN